MTLRLTVDTEPWRANVDHVRRHCPGLVPVVKGNGYGFGRAELAVIAA
ncbi:MAG: alanine racemase, partial [Ilumatobacteraceae bacterium]